MIERRDPWDLLSSHVQKTIAEAATAVGIPREEVRSVEWLNILLETLAVEHLTLELRQEHRWSRTKALEEACFRLDVSVNTHWSRIRRGRQAGRPASTSELHSDGAGATRDRPERPPR